MLYIFGDCTFDTERCELRHAGEMVTVEPKVFKVLGRVCKPCFSLYIA
jgi:DNA-binding winged helix-turn-helix (wHTH) protein